MWLKMIFSLFLTKFCLTCLLPLLASTFLRCEMNLWDAFSMKKKWGLYSGQHCGRGKAILRLLFFHNCLSPGCFCTTSLPAPPYSGSLRWVKSLLNSTCRVHPSLSHPTPLWILWVRGVSSQLSCIALHTLLLLAGVFSVRWVKEAD